MLLLDGAMGSYLWQLGYPYPQNPVLALFTHPKLVKQVHKEYLHVGSNMISTNTFYIKEEDLPNGETPSSVVKKAVRIAEESGAENILLSLGPMDLKDKGRKCSPW